VSTTPISAVLRRQIQERAEGRCEYGRLAQEDAYFSHEVDHIISEKHGGVTDQTNLAWSCFDCNRFKGSDISSIDPETRELVLLFNPRADMWSDRFEISSGTIEPLPPTGRVTEKILKLNLIARIEARFELTRNGRYH